MISLKAFYQHSGKFSLVWVQVILFCHSGMWYREMYHSDSLKVELVYHFFLVTHQHSLFQGSCWLGQWNLNPGKLWNAGFLFFCKYPETYFVKRLSGKRSAFCRELSPHRSLVTFWANLYFFYSNTEENLLVLMLLLVKLETKSWNQIIF